MTFKRTILSYGGNNYKYDKCCAECGHAFKPGEVYYVRSIRNIVVAYLCVSCHDSKYFPVVKMAEHKS